MISFEFVDDKKTCSRVWILDDEVGRLRMTSRERTWTLMLLSPWQRLRNIVYKIKYATLFSISTMIFFAKVQFMKSSDISAAVISNSLGKSLIHRYDLTITMMRWGHWTSGPWTRVWARNWSVGYVQPVERHQYVLKSDLSSSRALLAYPWFDTDKVECLLVCFSFWVLFSLISRKPERNYKLGDSTSSTQNQYFCTPLYILGVVCIDSVLTAKFRCLSCLLMLKYVFLGQLCMKKRREVMSTTYPAGLATNTNNRGVHSWRSHIDLMKI